MEKNRVQFVSEVAKIIANDDSISYGFTITYENGEIRNWIQQSKEGQDEKMMKKVELERQKWIKKNTNKKED